MRGWLSLAQNILQPPLPSFSLSLSLSRRLAKTRPWDGAPTPALQPEKTTAAEARGGSLRPWIDPYSTTSSSRPAGRERPERKESSTRVWLGLRLLPPRPTAARPFCSGHIDKQSVRRPRDLIFFSPPPPSRFCPRNTPRGNRRSSTDR